MCCRWHLTKGSRQHPHSELCGERLLCSVLLAARIESIAKCTAASAWRLSCSSALPNVSMKADLSCRWSAPTCRELALALTHSGERLLSSLPASSRQLVSKLLLASPSRLRMPIQHKP